MRFLYATLPAAVLDCLLAAPAALAQSSEDKPLNLTDDGGAFQIVDLPAGRYTVTVSKSGFVSLAYGQRRPLQPGTPVQLAEGQEIRNVDVRLPRGSVITGRVYDETGDAMRQSAKQGIVHFDLRFITHSEAKRWGVRHMYIALPADIPAANLTTPP